MHIQETDENPEREFIQLIKFIHINRFAMFQASSEWMNQFCKNGILSTPKFP